MISTPKHKYHILDAATPLNQIKVETPKIAKLAFTDTEDIEEAIEYLKEDQMLVLFIGAEAIGYWNSSSTGIEDMTRLGSAKRLMMADSGDLTDAEQDGLDIYVSLAVAANVEFTTVQALRKHKMYSVQKDLGAVNRTQLKANFNRNVAGYPNRCMLMLSKVGNNSEWKLDARLDWKNAQLADGDYLNYYAQLWQVTALKSLLECQFDLGSCISKLEAAHLYAIGKVTRYFQREPTDNEIVALRTKHRLAPETPMICLYRAIGCTAYERVALPDPMLL